MTHILDLGKLGKWLNKFDSILFETKQHHETQCLNRKVTECYYVSPNIKSDQELSNSKESLVLFF